MRWCNRLYLLLIFSTAITVVIEAQHMPKVEMHSWNSDAVLVETFDRAKFPAFQDAFPEGTSALEPVSLVLTNERQKNIFAIAVRWVVSDPAGNQRRITYRSDAYMSRGSSPVLGSHSKLVVSPGFAKPESLAGKPFIGPDERSRVLYSKMVSEADSVTVELDSVIFDDGEVIGLDELKFDVEISARYEAAQEVASRVRKEIAAGRNPSVLLQEIGHDTPTKSDHKRVWMAEYATKLMHARDIASGLGVLEALPNPPHFFRREN